VCEGANVIFTATAANAGNQPGYQWFLNGNPVGTGTTTLVVPAPSQGDQVWCQVTSNLGCSTGLTANSNTIPINVIETPLVSCSVTPGFANEPTFFEAAVVSGGLAPFTYTWNFGNNSFGSGNDVATVYPVAGSYNAQVDVTDANGCTGVCNLAVLIENFLSVNFNTGGLFNGCAPLPIQFFNQSVNAITFLWDFGDGNTSNLANPLHVYTSPGIYDVTLSGFSQVGNLSASVTSQIAVFPKPVANFSAYPQVVSEAGQTVYFTDNSLDAWSWNWNFGDPASGAANTSTLQNPTHVYASNGNYTVTLIVSNNYGCADTTVKNGFAQVHVGIEENNPLTPVEVFPNPFSQQFFIRAQQPPLLVRLTDISGKEIPVRIGMQHAAETPVWPMVPLASGIYLLQVDGQIFKLIAH
jgi:PKD repeat protein